VVRCIDCCLRVPRGTWIIVRKFSHASFLVSRGADERSRAANGYGALSSRTNDMLYRGDAGRHALTESLGPWSVNIYLGAPSCKLCNPAPTHPRRSTQGPRDGCSSTVLRLSGQTQVYTVSYIDKQPSSGPLSPRTALRVTTQWRRGVLRPWLRGSGGPPRARNPTSPALVDELAVRARLLRVGGEYDPCSPLGIRRPQRLLLPRLVCSPQRFLPQR
jgi:hypothetical protein